MKRRGQGWAVGVAALAMVAAGVLASPRAQACSCFRQGGIVPGSPMVKAMFERASLVARGRVIGVCRTLETTLYTFEVDTVWKGPLERRAHLRTATSSARCGVEIELGQKLFVFADGPEHAISLCGIVAPADHPVLPQALAELAKPGTRLQKPRRASGCDAFGAVAEAGIWATRAAAEKTAPTRVAVPAASATRPGAAATCSLPRDVGPCRARMERWTFDAAARRCERFWYGGCLGNANRFQSEESCAQTCGR